MFAVTGKFRPSLLVMLSVLTCQNGLTRATNFNEPNDINSSANITTPPAINPNFNQLTDIPVIGTNGNGENAKITVGLLEKIKQSGVPGNSISLLVQKLGKNPHIIGSDSATPQMPTNAPVATNAPIISYLPHVPRTPASTQKLIPTLIALDSLGKDFRWVTRIYQQGLVIGDTLHGNLIIKGSGDPKLNHDQLRTLLSGLQAKGIAHIQGDIVLDNRIFQQVNFNPNTFDGQGLKAYNAPPNGLLINFGTLEVDFIPSGKFTIVSPISLPLSAPVADGLQTQASADTGINPDENATNSPNFIPDPTANSVAVKLLPPLADYAYPKSLPATHEPCNTSPRPNLSKTALSYTGQISANCGLQSNWFTFPDSDTFIKKAVKGTWLTLDPTFKGDVRLISESANTTSSNTPSKFAKWEMPLPIVSLPSYTLGNQIWDINHYSNNVMTEQVTLSLPVYAGGKQASDYPTAFNFIQNWWQTHLAPAKPPIMSRGSGLCRDCLVEPASMLALLNYGFDKADFATFHDSMGIAGVSGTMKTLKKRHPDSPAIGNAWIKTGTLDNVTSMVGYVKSQSGDWYAVVGMINAPNVGHNDKVKAILDEMLAWTAVQ